MIYFFTYTYDMVFIENLSFLMSQSSMLKIKNQKSKIKNQNSIVWVK